MNNIDIVLTLTEFKNLRDLEYQLFDMIEGELDFNKRRIHLILVGEKEGIKFYKSVCNDNTGWIPKINTNENILGNIEYWIAPNAILVYPKIIKEYE